ncbi:MAG: prolipoprotein diacylglyceryl transferase [Candidatus Komeilibacteria bacterium]|nr:prolipoprotein diacylglyceryl transferase [Candidatus Komeilibacteria bacterium]
MFNFLHNFSPAPILLDAGVFRIYWYGLIMAMAAGAGFMVFLKLAKTGALPKARIFDLGFYLIIWGIIGARLWHVLFYNSAYFLSNPLKIFKLWHGGLAIFGSIFAGCLVLFYFSKKSRISFWLLADLAAVALPLGQAIGRWGNYFNQELFGRPCSYSWCIPINAINRPEQYLNFQYFQPVFLYESLLCLALFILCFNFFKIKRLPVGTTVLVYLAGYSAIRFVMEFWRLDVSGSLFSGLKWTQWLCLAVMVISIIFLVNKKRKQLAF